MDEERARELLHTERARVLRLLGDTQEAQGFDHAEERESGDSGDVAEALATEGVDDAFAADLRGRLAALDRAEERLDRGAFGHSVRSGRPIPDDRLEADPAAELTIDEAEAER